MSSTSERFLKAEEAAQELVATLETLKKEVSSYQSAGQDLALARNNLIEFTNALDPILRHTGEIVEELRRVGAPEILTRLSDLEAKCDAQAAGTESAIKRGFTRLTILFTVALIFAVLATLLSLPPLWR